MCNARSIVGDVDLQGTIFFQELQQVTKKLRAESPKHGSKKSRPPASSGPFSPAVPSRLVKNSCNASLSSLPKASSSTLTKAGSREGSQAGSPGSSPIASPRGG
eukprot:1071474-Prorocentrum_minimum.AAC.1